MRFEKLYQLPRRNGYERGDKSHQYKRGKARGRYPTGIQSQLWSEIMPALAILAKVF